jgi:xylulokinase
MSDSAGTSWLDVGKRDWSQKLLEAGGMHHAQMPALVEGNDAAGSLRPDLAAHWGVSAGVTVAGGAGDNAAAACGVGALVEGDGFVSLGTSGVLLAARDSFTPAPESAVHTFCHAIPGRWYQMGVILSATDSLNWLSQRLGASPQDLSAALAGSIGAPGSIRFLPYMSGERTPHNDSQIRGALIGLDIASTNEDLTRAIMEGVAFALRDSLEALKSTGASLDRVLGIGGGAQSPYWIELLATVLDMPIDLPDSQELGAALGAARLAICAATGAAPEDIMHRPPVAKTIEPRGDLTNAYEAAYAKYRALYPALKDLP